MLVWLFSKEYIWDFFCKAGAMEMDNKHFCLLWLNKTV